MQLLLVIKALFGNNSFFLVCFSYSVTTFLIGDTNQAKLPIHGFKCAVGVKPCILKGLRCSISNPLHQFWLNLGKELSRSLPYRKPNTFRFLGEKVVETMQSQNTKSLFDVDLTLERLFANDNLGVSHALRLRR